MSNNKTIKFVSFLLICFLFYANQSFALNQVNNSTFNGNANGWTFVNDDGFGAEGSACTGTATSTADNAFTALGYEQGNVAANHNDATNNIAQRGFTWQSFTVPGTGNQLVRASTTLSSLGASWNATANTSWTRLDVVGYQTFTYVGTLGCTSYNANVATTTIGLDRTLTLTGGTRYFLMITMRKKTTSGNPINDRTWIDNIGLSTPPVNVAVSSVSASTNTSLSWDVSTATTTAASINASTPYKVYRSTTLGTETFLDNATTNSYTDTTTTGNTTYYYWVTNMDTNSFESASSTEVSVLTRPGAPTSPTIGSITSSTLQFSWTAPTGGASTYKVERCTGTGCSNYAEIGTGISDTFYNDSNLSASTVYRYRVRATNATGDGAYSSGVEGTTLEATATSVVYSSIFNGGITFQGGTTIR